MRHYRLFFFDSAGHITQPATLIEAETDEEAIAASHEAGHGAMELWQRQRLVHRFEARRLEA